MGPTLYMLCLYFCSIYLQYVVLITSLMCVSSVTCSWLNVSVANLTCTLRGLQEVWHGGSLPAQHRPVHSHQQKEDTKQQSMHCLRKLLPGK